MPTEELSRRPPMRAAAPETYAASSTWQQARFTERPVTAQCPCCSGRRMHYAFSTRGCSSENPRRVVHCSDCGLMLLNPQPSDAELVALATHVEGYSPATESMHDMHGLLKAISQRAAMARSMLVIGEETRGLIEAAAASGFKVTLQPGLDGSVAPPPTDLSAFDVVLLDGVLERSRDPRQLLTTLRQSLTIDGILAIFTSALHGDVSRQRSKWPQFPPQQLWFFTSETVQNLLFRCGFHQVTILPDRRPDQHQLTVLATAAPPRRQPLLSIVLPAYNEADTIEPLLESLLAKRFEGLDVEVIIVESNSTDGTRQLVQRYADRDNIRLLFQDRAKGKGNAVRAGLELARGDFVLIQDADLEYDLEDYDMLLEPLICGRRALVLGSRHGGRAWWKMRQFARAPLVSFYFNLGHWFFTTLINLLFHQRLKDPCTMYKVFRRDCLFGLDFQCDRFDFDFELLIKLIQKGYEPLEIPVNYRSRSYSEGKKVTAFGDPLRGLRTLLRLRMSPPRSADDGAIA